MAHFIVWECRPRHGNSRSVAVEHRAFASPLDAFNTAQTLRRHLTWDIVEARSADEALCRAATLWSTRDRNPTEGARWSGRALMETFVASRRKRSAARPSWRVTFADRDLRSQSGPDLTHALR